MEDHFWHTKNSELGIWGTSYIENRPEDVFPTFNKIPRLNRGICITEKIDGRNSVIQVSDDGLSIRAGSRNRWIQPGKQTDNYGFAGWVERNKEELLKLGPGIHPGEWWGAGIQRRYGLQEKRFSLFNVHKWVLDQETVTPECCSVVPILYRGPLNHHVIAKCLYELQTSGSVAVPGFMSPEGICIYHEAAKIYFKVTIENDSEPKGKA